MEIRVNYDDKVFDWTNWHRRCLSHHIISFDEDMIKRRLFQSFYFEGRPYLIGSYRNNIPYGVFKRFKISGRVEWLRSYHKGNSHGVMIRFDV